MHWARRMATKSNMPRRSKTTRGNALQRAGLAFDPEAFTAFRIECEKAFTPEFFRVRNDWGAPSAAPIFIVGMPRSGSTLIEQILLTHSAIEGLGELAELDRWSAG